ncbi:MAG: hypothetical protein UW41_C0016G0001 [Candidatus Collierbacteria bacterium GW2011_GWC2_44_18]|uniref:Uncharacterized protein n=1 Tax=Candidatus Collierbacteria bacterium GW2011_GWC2_44_18 TaxID=1618392 RepID=A0A0G1KLN3_9BACT|nr:MAG: hypothetical protein UW41_C0016G0001 [Candidatus Collierbacteria bacterium GW2011_GWC2_44_18]
MSADPFVIFGVLLAVLAVVFIIVLVRSSRHNGHFALVKVEIMFDSSAKSRTIRICKR